MPHITPQTLDRLFDREQDFAMCVHGARTRLAKDGSSAVVRIVGHLVLEVPEEDGQETPEEFCLVVDLPMSTECLARIAGLFDETMGQMVDSALGAIIAEDGET